MTMTKEASSGFRRAAAGVAALAVFTAASVSGADAAAGENGFAFLKIGVGTDAVGMGNAYVSQVRDATATYWNPAGLSSIAGTDVVVMHNEFIADLRMEYAAAGRSFGRHGIGISFAGLFTDDLEGRDASGQPTGEVGFHDLAFTLGYSYAINGELSLGASARYLREFIGNAGATEDHVATGSSFDLGAQYRRGPWQFGVAAQNLGSDLSFNQVETVSTSGTGSLVGGTSFGLPTAVQGGVTWRGLDVGDGRVEVALEGRQVSGEDFSVNVGSRYRYRNLASLSVGYRSGLDTEDVSFGLNIHKEALRVGYAFVPYQDDLGNSHRISLGYTVADK